MSPNSFPIKDFQPLKINSGHKGRSDDLKNHLFPVTRNIEKPRAVISLAIVAGNVVTSPWFFYAQTTPREIITQGNVKTTYPCNATQNMV